MAGPFYFAWVDPTETAFTSAHAREDEQVLAFDLSHDEGNFPSLQLTILNPRVGFLSPGRKTWGWLSYDRNWKAPPPEQDDSEFLSDSEGSESESERNLVPLFFGRLIGVPDNLQDEQVTISFIARPEDYAQQQAAIAATKRVAPYFDPIWFAPDQIDDPDNVLESRPELWHTDRVTLEVSTSNIITGEDGTIPLGEGDIFYDSMSLSYGESPVRRVEMNASVSWDQAKTGTVNIITKIIDAFRGAGSSNGFYLASYTGKALQDDWPQPGTSLDGGWSVSKGSLSTGSGRQPEEFIDPFPMGRYMRYGTFKDHTAGVGTNGFNSPFATWYLGGGYTPKLWFPLWVSIGELEVGYDVSRNKSETLTMVLEADVQATITEPGDEEVISLSMSSSEVNQPIDAGGALPIGFIWNASYFSTDRGAQSIEYLIAVMRAQLLARARTVTLSIEIPFNLGVDLDLSCRKNVIVTDYRLPGGVAGGKIISYSLSADGESGAFNCSISLGCTVGKGNTVTGSEGTPVYVNNGYVNSGYQRYEGRFVMPIAGEVTYESINGIPPTDDGIDFNRMIPSRVVKSVVVTGGVPVQEAAMAVGGGALDIPAAFAKLNTVPTQVTLTMRNLTGGPFKTTFVVNTSDLMVPKTIDLEANT